MDSLLANYASSDEEQEEASVEQRTNPPPNQKQAKKIEVGEKIEDFLSENTSKSIKFSLPPPKSSSSFSLHPPKPHQHKQEDSDDSDDDDRELQRVENRENSKTSSLFSSLAQPKSSSSLFSSLPPPKTHVSDPQPSPSPKPKPNTAPDPVSGTSAKRVVQFRPPLNPSLGKYRDFDDEDEDEEEQAKRRKKVESSGQTASVKSFLSSIPAPKNSATLGALPSASGTGRRSIVETSNSSSVSGGSEVGGSGNMGGDNDGGQYVDGAPMSSSGGVSGSLDYTVGGGSSSGGDYSNWGAGNENYVNYDGNTGYGNVDYSNWSAANGDYPSYGSDSRSYGNYGQYENNWSDGSTTLPAESELRLSAKRGRKDAPPQIVEVNQDELMKNRPREDQAKLTGIAFGPSYQPVSTKGKPTKLHKRKHQIGSLYFDMKQKEMELAERRAKGFLTKAQTQGKYGW